MLIACLFRIGLFLSRYRLSSTLIFDTFGLVEWHPSSHSPTLTQIFSAFCTSYVLNYPLLYPLLYPLTFIYPPSQFCLSVYPSIISLRSCPLYPPSWVVMLTAVLSCSTCSLMASRVVVLWPVHQTPKTNATNARWLENLTEWPPGTVAKGCWTEDTSDIYSVYSQLYPLLPTLLCYHITLLPHYHLLPH